MSIAQLLNIAPFADYKETIKALYLADEEFKLLCDDYYTSKMNIEKFKARSMEDKQMEQEYKELATELEKEIIEYIRKKN